MNGGRRLRFARHGPVWVLALGLLLAHPATADTLDDIQQRGKLVVGVKKDVPLWGQIDPKTGELVGLEPDLAADLAARLGVKLELVGLLSAERQEAIDSGRVDLMIATLSDTPQRRKTMTLVEPHYYASGTNVLARRSAGFTQWRDLRDRRVCGRRGAFYNRTITVNYGVDIVALYSNSLALAALRDGRCDAVLYDDTNIIALLQESTWAARFHMPLETVLVTPWAIALNKREDGGRLARWVSQQVVDWHRSGSLIALEEKWHIPPSAYSRKMNGLWNRKVRGAYYCGQEVVAHAPKECL